MVSNRALTSLQGSASMPSQTGGSAISLRDVVWLMTGRLRRKMRIPVRLRFGHCSAAALSLCLVLVATTLIIRDSELLSTIKAYAFASTTATADPQGLSINACIDIMRRRGHYDFSAFLSAQELPLYSWVRREAAADTRRRKLHPSSPTVPSLCEQVALKYPLINSPNATHEMRVRMLVDFVYRVIPWRESGVEDAGIVAYENLQYQLGVNLISSAAQFNDMDIEDLASAFAYYESGHGSVVCGGFAWMLSFTLQYFGYWAVTIDSKFWNSFAAADEGEVVNGHHTVMARICDDNARKCKWVHLDPSIGSVIVHTKSQQMASFFNVIESFYALQSNEGYSVVRAWTQPSGAPQARSLLPAIMQDCSKYWTLLDLCGSPLNAIAVPSRADNVKMIHAPRLLKNMVSEVVLPADRLAWWFHTTPTAPQSLEQPSSFRSNCSENRIASVSPPCVDDAGCDGHIPATFFERVTAELMQKVACTASTFGASKSDGRMRFLIRDDELRYIIWMMRCSTMPTSIFAGPDGLSVQLCRDAVQSTSSNQHPVTASALYSRPPCVARLEAYSQANHRSHA